MNKVQDVVQIHSAGRVQHGFADPPPAAEDKSAAQMQAGTLNGRPSLPPSSSSPSPGVNSLG